MLHSGIEFFCISHADIKILSVSDLVDDYFPEFVLTLVWNGSIACIRYDLFFLDIYIHETIRKKAVNDLIRDMRRGYLPDLAAFFFLEHHEGLRRIYLISQIII